MQKACQVVSVWKKIPPTDYLLCKIMEKASFDPLPLKTWFAEHKRDLPWRGGTDPYAVWISEIMLQQTQVAVVKEYFIKWMKHFPTIQALASANLEEVIKMWEGLGYYSRARNLHEAARYLVQEHGGKLPSSKEELAKVKGLGPYTVGAIRSFAFKQKAPAVDGNVIRVLSRYFAIEKDVKQLDTIREIWLLAEEILPENEPWIIAEALIELGATVCKKDPQCFHCPLQKNCVALKKKIQLDLPIKSCKTTVTHLRREVFIIVHDEHLLLKKGAKGKVMADLYEFPYTEMGGFPFSLKATKVKSLPTVNHTFTRYKATLIPSLWNAVEQISIPEYDWVPLAKLPHLPFSSGHRRILRHLLNEEFCR